MVAKNHHAIECNICCRWIHLKCNKLSEKEYNFFQENINMPFFCIKCMADSIPFLTLDDKQFEFTAKGIDYTEEIDLSSIFISQPQLEMLDRFNAAINNITFDLNEENNIIESENIIPHANCKYYTIDEFHTQKFNSDKHFSILHLNISSIEYHIEEFRIVLELLKHKFDFICISESKRRTNREPKVDIKIEGYQQPIGIGFFQGWGTNIY